MGGAEPSPRPDVAGSYPAVEVSFAWGVASSAVPAALDWVDESAYVSSLDIKHGTEDEFSQPGAAGTLEVTLDNHTGRFDPDNSSGALYGDLNPLTWVRVRGGDSSVDTDVFYGQVSIEGFRLSASQFTGQMVVQVTVVDMLEQLANTDLAASVWDYEVSLTTPDAWWKHDEGSGRTLADSSGNGHHGTYEGGATFNSRAGLIVNDPGTAIAYDGVDDYAVIPAIAGFGPGDVTVAAWFTTELKSGATADATLIALADYAGAPQLVLEQNWSTYSGALRADINQDEVRSTSVPTAGSTYFVVVRRSGLQHTLWLNAVDVSTGALNTGADSWGYPGTITIGAADSRGANPWNGMIDDVVVWERALSDAEIAALYAAGTAPWDGELTSARITHLLDSIDFPATLRTIDTGQSTMPAASLATDALSALQETATAENGDLYVDHHAGGKVRFRDRHAKWTDTRSVTSQATFGDGAGEVTYSGVDIQDDRIINYATVQRANGATMVAQDATSMTQYQRRTLSESGLLIETDAEAQYRANLIVAEKKDRHRRVRSVTLEPAKSTHPAWAQVFAREIGDRVTVKWRPPYGGTYTFVSWIIGISHSWRPASSAPWRTTFYLEPVPYGATGNPYFIVGTDLVSGPAKLGY